MKPRWYFRWHRWLRWRTVFTDEVGSFRIRCTKNGWYEVVNHYGNIQVICWPGSFWWGVRRYYLKLKGRQ
jgi:hypothetical protein